MLSRIPIESTMIEMLDADTAENERIRQLTGSPPNPPRAIEDYYSRWNDDESDYYLFAGFLIGIATITVLKLWSDVVRNNPQGCG